MPADEPTFANILLAFRVAKRMIATERGCVGLFNLARFEMQLASRIRGLRKLLKDNQWFDFIDIGRMVVMPKSTEPATKEKKPDIVRIGNAPPTKVDLNVRLQLEPTPEFTVTEVLYLWEFGAALEALLDNSCVGYRLKRVSTDRRMDRFDREVYEHWPSAFERYREDPINAARAALEDGKHVTVTSTDVVSFFDCIDPQFLLQRTFVAELRDTAHRLDRSFSVSRYRTATRSLLGKFGEFRRLRRSVGGAEVDIEKGVPIGALTSRVFANIALASVDNHIQGLPEVILYRRYVDDIVIVSARDAATEPPESKARVLGRLFPGFQEGECADVFVVPATRATFELKEAKTRVHDLVGAAGIDFLGAVRQSFSVVTSERRAFLGNIERLETEIEDIDLFSDGATGTDRIPRLRDADRFTLRRFIVTAIVRGLERCALLLDAQEASSFIEQRTKRILSIVDDNVQLEDFELILSLLKVSLLCDCQTVSEQLRGWLERRAGEDLLGRVDEVSWRGQLLRRRASLRALDTYLNRRIDESIASAYAVAGPTLEVSDPKARRQAILLRRTGLRHLDREDDVAVFGNLKSELPPRTRLEHVAARKAVKIDDELNVRLAHVQSLLDRSSRLGEQLWKGVSDVGLLLSLRPPRYVDVARRFLARAETGRLPSEVGAHIEACVDALRGTRYQRRWFPTIATATTKEISALIVKPETDSSHFRVILSNLPVGYGAFKAAVNDRPLLTIERLKTLDHSLRDAQRATRQANRKQIKSILLLPELSIPHRWSRALAEHAVREKLSVVAGMEYRTTAEGLVSQALGVFPTGMWSAAIVRWTKRYPARREEAELKKLGKKLAVSPLTARRLVVEMGDARIGVLICSEMLEASSLSALSSHVELLLVPSWNDDAPSFDHIAHATASLLVHAFVCVANNAEASDSRIVAPIKEPRYEREWCRLIHRGENQVIWGDLPVAELRRIHDGTEVSSVSLEDEDARIRVYRPLPPGWKEHC
jgi:predicted amidohydrolase